jgi:hypothetical protein
LILAATADLGASDPPYANAFVVLLPAELTIGLATIGLFRQGLACQSRRYSLVEV